MHVSRLAHCRHQGPTTHCKLLQLTSAPVYLMRPQRGPERGCMPLLEYDRLVACEDQ
jgi:hypothetical protein